MTDPTLTEALADTELIIAEATVFDEPVKDTVVANIAVEDTKGMVVDEPVEDPEVMIAYERVEDIDATVAYKPVEDTEAMVADEPVEDIEAMVDALNMVGASHLYCFAYGYTVHESHQNRPNPGWLVMQSMF